LAQTRAHSILFPRGVRLWHFIVFPAIGMGVAIALFRTLDAYAFTDLGPVAGSAWLIVRTLLITVLMASLIAWLALKHKAEYEAELHAGNAMLMATRDFLQSVIEGSGEAIVTLDSEGRVTSWNRAAERIYGWTAPEMAGQTVERVLPDDPEARADWARSMLALREGRTIRDSESTRIRKDGTRIQVRITRSPLEDPSGRYAGSTAIIRDVTDLKEMETRLLERERLAAVGELAAQVAHEIKNPLAGIRGACEILSKGYRSGAPGSDMATEVIRQVDRLNRTVEELLLFARPREVRPSPTDIHSLLDRTLGVVLEDPKTRDIEVVRRYAPSMPVLRVDPQQMEQVLFNVLLNAIQAVDYRGRITVTTRANGATAQIAIRDTGPGIPPGIEERIFKPFFTTHAQGCGLGLAIVRNLVQAHGGSIRGESLPGGGAEFTITLPTEPYGS
jgi:PAS domain S-box-containing protein